MNRRRNKSKKKAQKQHTTRRLKERYGLRYTQLLRDTIIHQIRNGEAECVYRQSLRVTVWDVEYDVKENDIYDATLAEVGLTKIRVVYDSNRKELVTALDLNMDPRDIYEEIH